MTAVHSILMEFLFWLYLTINAGDFRLIPLDRNTNGELYNRSSLPRYVKSLPRFYGEIFKQVARNIDCLKHDPI